MPALVPPWLGRLARWTVLVLVAFLLLFASVWKGWILPSDRQYKPRTPDPAAVVVPKGYRVEVLATGLNAPSALEVAPDGSVYIAESGYGGAYAATAGVEGQIPGRILRLDPSGRLEVVAGGFNPPLAGLVHDERGNLFVSHNGTISVVAPGKGAQDVVTGLPSLGDHRNNQITLGPDGKLYITQGTVTNSGIVGLDSWVLWGRFFPAPRDIPCRDVVLNGVNVTTADPRSVIPFSRVQTGAYSPFGHRSEPNQVVEGQLPCNGSIMRVNPDGTGLELVAWGLRNPFDIRFDKAGALWVTDNGPDTRGSRPFEGEDLLVQVKEGAYYGWPDFWNGQPAWELPTSGREEPKRLLARPPQKISKAFTTLGLHVGATGFDFAPSKFGFEGQMFVARWGTGYPATSQRPEYAGFDVARVDLRSGKSEVFAVNTQRGPASLQKGGGGFERPVGVRFGPDGAMYVLDWGHLAVTRKGPYHVPDGGVLWRISRVGAAVKPFRNVPAVAPSATR